MSNETKETAVEWLIEQLRKNENIRWKGTNIIELGDQAKEMEKERIENAFNSGYNNGGLDTCLTPKQYYNETYGGNNENL